jgi:hypothetical protein
MYKPGDPVVFCKTKQSVRPGPRAKAIDPAPQGDDYTYLVDKFWVVSEVRDDKLTLLTRRGKTHVVDVGDPHIRRPRWWERLWYRNRFPQLSGPAPAAPNAPVSETVSR